MRIAEVKVAKTTCETTCIAAIPKGIVGATVSIEYTDSVWEDLQKTVVFRSSVTKDAIAAGNEVVIPAEVVSHAGMNLYMGVYGVNAENNVVIPTIWTDLGMIRSAAAPSGDASSDPSLPVWAQIQAMIGNLDDLNTDAKSSLVAAINEAPTKDDLSDKLPKSPANWEPWTAEEQAAARDRIGIPEDYELIEVIDETFDDYTFIERDKEPDGTPYNFARVYVFITLYKDSGKCGGSGSGFAYDADDNYILEYRTELGAKTATGFNYSAFWKFGVGMNTVFSAWGNQGDRMNLYIHGISVGRHNVAKKNLCKD